VRGDRHQLLELLVTAGAVIRERGVETRQPDSAAARLGG
jgi:hypothetical protein